MIHFELRDGPDDLPYAKTYDTRGQAARAAQSKANRLQRQIQVWRMSDRGEFMEGYVEPQGRAW